MNRDAQLLALRPTIDAAVVSGTMTNEEKFQNQTLRPILKWQNPLLLSVFRHHIKLRKNVFSRLSVEERCHYIVQALQKDITLRSTLKGIMVGQFTDAEFRQYASMTRAVDKRMLQMIEQRLQSQLPALNQPEEER